MSCDAQRMVLVVLALSLLLEYRWICIIVVHKSPLSDDSLNLSWLPPPKGVKNKVALLFLQGRILQRVYVCQILALALSRLVLIWPCSFFCQACLSNTV